jgi:hypothetical protein|tara:strand:- start:3 stop:659 length:657 start_codon:yes stop_codon:yes gene_type:complete
MKIATFGCSWTHGLYEVNDFYSWPYALHKLKPDWQIDNYAVCGSSLQLQTFLLDDVLRNNTYDKIIFQITTPGRLSYFEEDYDMTTALTEYETNYKRIETEDGFFRKVVTITPGHMQLPKTNSFWRLHGKYKYARSYYGMLNKSIFRTEYKALVYYLKDKVDLMFMHNEDSLKLDICPVVMEEVKKENIAIDSFIADNGEHFNIEGCDWEAKWVLDRL